VAPGFIASSAETTTGSSSYSTLIFEHASSATFLSSATTTATPCPVKVTLSISNTLGVLALLVIPPACQAQGIGFKSSKSLPVHTPKTPGIFSASEVSMFFIFA
ncbi:uncharacterized protein METZ01_LOCUS111021, partial [marine metagenome]